MKVEIVPEEKNLGKGEKGPKRKKIGISKSS